MDKKLKKTRAHNYTPKLKVKGSFLDLVKLSVKDEKKKDKDKEDK